MKSIAIIGASNDARKYELWLNPGSESEEVLAEAARLGLNVLQACRIVGVGLSPESL